MDTTTQLSVLIWYLCFQFFVFGLETIWFTRMYKLPEILNYLLSYLLNYFTQQILNHLFSCFFYLVLSCIKQIFLFQISEIANVLQMGAMSFRYGPSMGQLCHFSFILFTYAQKVLAIIIFIVCFFLFFFSYRNRAVNY